MLIPALYEAARALPSQKVVACMHRHYISSLRTMRMQNSKLRAQPARPQLKIARIHAGCWRVWFVLRLRNCRGRFRRCNRTCGTKQIYEYSRTVTGTCRVTQGSQFTWLPVALLHQSTTRGVPATLSLCVSGAILLCTYVSYRLDLSSSSGHAQQRATRISCWDCCARPRPWQA